MKTKNYMIPILIIILNQNSISQTSLLKFIKIFPYWHTKVGFTFTPKKYDYVNRKLSRFWNEFQREINNINSNIIILDNEFITESDEIIEYVKVDTNTIKRIEQILIEKKQYKLKPNAFLFTEIYHDERNVIFEAKLIDEEARTHLNPSIKFSFQYVTNSDTIDKNITELAKIFVDQMLSKQTEVIERFIGIERFYRFDTDRYRFLNLPIFVSLASTVYTSLKYNSLKSKFEDYSENYNNAKNIYEATLYKTEMEKNCTKQKLYRNCFYISFVSLIVFIFRDLFFFKKSEKRYKSIQNNNVGVEINNNTYLSIESTFSKNAKLLSLSLSF